MSDLTFASVCLGIVLLGSGTHAEPSGAFLGQRIEAIEVEFGKSGNLDFSRAEAMQYIDVRPGDRFSVQAVRRSVKLLYHLGLFGQVRVAARAGDSGLVLIFRLEPQRRVRAIEYFGNEQVPAEDLSRLSRLERGEEYDHWKMEASAVDMLRLYAARGYRRARIVSKAEDAKEGHVKVGYFVQEGSPTRISRIWFRGQTIFPHARLQGVMGLEPGDVLGRKRLEESVARLREFYLKQGYLEAKVEGPKLAVELEALLEVVPVQIEPGPVIELRFEGNQVVTGKALKKALNLDKGGVFNEFSLRDHREALERLYQKQGFAKAQVESEIQLDRERNRKQVIFRVEEGPRVTVRDLRFEGNQAVKDGQLRAYVHDAMIEAIPQSGLAQPVDRGDMDPLGGGHPLRGKPRKVNRPQGFLFELVPQTIYIRESYEKAFKAIEDFYLSKGYLDVEIDSPVLSYDESGSNLFATVPIREGPQTLVESISFVGNQAIAADELLAVADRLNRFVKPGAPLDQYGVEVLRKELSRVYARKGYAYCQVEQEVNISKDRRSAEVLFVFVEGPQVRVGRVLVQGNLTTDRKVFDNLVSLRPGEVLSPDQVGDSRDRLLSLGVFAGVDIKSLDPDVVEPVKDLVVHVRERMESGLDFWPGISTGEGVRAALAYTRRNLFGYAIESVNRVKVSYQVFYLTPLVSDPLRDRYRESSFFEGLEWRVMSGLHLPRLWWWDLDLAGRFDVLGLRDHAPSYDLTKVSVTPGVDFKWTDELRFSVEYELEYTDFTCPFTEENEPCGGSTVDLWLRYDEGTLVLGSLRPELSWDFRDSPFNPHRGVLVALRTEFAHTFTLSREVLYVKFDGQLSGYIPTSARTTLALSVRAGAIIHLTDDSRTPSHKLFFLGGRNTVRGFEEENLIPADLDPPCILGSGFRGKRKCVSPGGNAFVTIKAEFRFPLFSDLLEGAIFADVGNLWLEPSNISPYDLRPTAGVGLRVTTPIGPLAFDFGFNLMPDEDRNEQPFNLHFNVGVF